VLFSSRVGLSISVRITFSLVGKLLCTRICATLGFNCHTTCSVQTSQSGLPNTEWALDCLHVWETIGSCNYSFSDYVTK